MVVELKDGVEVPVSEQEKELAEALGNPVGKTYKLNIEKYEREEDVPEQARELWKLFHGDN